MTAILEDPGFAPDSSERDSMAWMDMRTPLSQMPGMASAEQVATFAEYARAAELGFQL